jgi:hypothetical protein
MKTLFFGAREGRNGCGGQVLVDMAKRTRSPHSLQTLSLFEFGLRVKIEAGAEPSLRREFVS